MNSAQNQKNTTQANTTSKGIYLGGLHFRVTSELLQAYFSKFGKVFSAEIRTRTSKPKKNPNKAVSLGWGILRVSEDAYRRIMAPQAEHWILNSKIDCQPFLEGEERRKFQEARRRKRVEVENLPLEVDDQLLEEVFASFGQVFNAYVRTDLKSGVKTGKGVVLFETEEGAGNAVEADGFVFAGNKLKIWNKVSKSGAQIGSKKKKSSKESGSSLRSQKSQSILNSQKAFAGKGAREKPQTMGVLRLGKNRESKLLNLRNDEYWSVINENANSRSAGFESLEFSEAWQERARKDSKVRSDNAELMKRRKRGRRRREKFRSDGKDHRVWMMKWGLFRNGAFLRTPTSSEYFHARIESNHREWNIVYNLKKGE